MITWNFRDSFLFCLLVAVILLLPACSSGKKKLRPGRCVYNEDCDKGMACRDTFCEDIYHPQSKIKSF